jgi:hypothetical protein
MRTAIPRECTIILLKMHRNMILLFGWMMMYMSVRNLWRIQMLGLKDYLDSEALPSKSDTYLAGE